MTFEQLKAWVVLARCCFLTGHGDVGSAVEAVRTAPGSFLRKPFQDNMLVDPRRAGHARRAPRRLETEREAQRLRQAWRP